MGAVLSTFMPNVWSARIGEVAGGFVVGVPIIDEPRHGPDQFEQPTSPVSELELDARRNLCVAPFHEHAEAFQLVDAIVENLRCQARQLAFETTRPVDASIDCVEDRQRPLAPQDLRDAMKRFLTRRWPAPRLAWGGRGRGLGLAFQNVPTFPNGNRLVRSKSRVDSRSMASPEAAGFDPGDHPTLGARSCQADVGATYDSRRADYAARVRAVEAHRTLR